MAAGASETNGTHLTACVPQVNIYTYGRERQRPARCAGSAAKRDRLAVVPLGGCPYPSFRGPVRLRVPLALPCLTPTFAIRNRLFSPQLFGRGPRHGSRTTRTAHDLAAAADARGKVCPRPDRARSGDPAAAQVSDFRDLSRPVRRRSHYPTMLALGNALKKLVAAGVEADVLANYLQRADAGDPRGRPPRTGQPHVRSERVRSEDQASCISVLLLTPHSSLFSPAPTARRPGRRRL